jgi:hypothetical protein
LRAQQDVAPIGLGVTTTIIGVSTRIRQRTTPLVSMRTEDCLTTPNSQPRQPIRGDADLDAQQRTPKPSGRGRNRRLGAGLARYLHEQNVEVLEVRGPDRRLRRQRGKSDPIDADAAARTVLAGNASGAPKLADEPIEAIRMLRVARLGAVKARTAAINTLRAMVITAPDALRSQLDGLSAAS